MSAERLPVLATRRVLVPGTTATLPASGREVEAGEEIVAVFAPAGRLPSPASVGTRAVAEAVRALGPEVSLLRLRGGCLVRLLGVHGAGAWGAAEVAPVAEPGPGAGELGTAVERELRRYLALRAEAGEAVRAPLRLSRDPVEASHEVASLLRISWPELEDILEAGSAAARLRREGAVLDREAELLRRLLGREGA